MESFEQTPAEQQPVPLTENPDLLAIAETDILLADRLRAIRLAQALQQSDPENNVFHILHSDMEKATRDYLAATGYAWEEKYPDNTTEQP